jgi:Uma2 family endonuclease
VELGAFDCLRRKIELIRGEICEMNPAGPVHDDLIAFLINWSVRSTDPSAIRVTAQTGLELVELDSRPEPDLLWVRAGRYLTRHPSAADVILAIEVSDISLQDDLVHKSALYAEAGIVEYWIVDVPNQCIHVFRQPLGSNYCDRSLSKLGSTLAPLASCTSPLNVSELFGGEALRRNGA